LGNSFVKYIFILIVVIVLLVAFWHVISDKNKVDSGSLDQTSTINTIQKDLRFGIAQLDTMNPIISTNRNVHEISKIIFEPLVNLNENYKKEYCLAESIEKESDTSYRVHLRRNIQWSDGSPFTANDVKFTVDSIKRGDINSIYKANLAYVGGLEAVDDNTVVFSLSEPVDYFEYYLTFPIMSAKNYEGTSMLDGERNAAPIGTGMFAITNINGNVYYLDKNPNYWNKSKDPLVEHIIISCYSSIGEVYNAFKAGDLDLVISKTKNVEQYVGTIGYSKVEYKNRKYDFLSFNTTYSFLADPQVRKAISLVIDRNNIIATSLGPGYSASNFPLDMGHWLYTKDLNITPNIDQARAILQQAGWTYTGNAWYKNGQRLEFAISVNNSDGVKMAAATNIVNQLANFGIATSIVQISNNNYMNIINQKAYQCIITGIECDFSPSIDYFFGENNIANYRNEEVLNLINESKNTNDENIQYNNYSRIFDIYLEEAPYIGLYRETQCYLYNNGFIGNIVPNSFNLFYTINQWYRQ